MSSFAAVLLGIVQGLTEFLPVSSSAHLILVREIGGWQTDPTIDLLFDVACHLGTLVAVIAYFWTDLWALVLALPRALSSNPGRDGQRLRLIVAGTVPIVIVGGLFGHKLEDSVRTAGMVIVPLALFGILMWVAERVHRARRPEGEMTMIDALIIGTAQAAAIVPGVSRSGSTLSAGLFLGFERAEIARFSFLLSVPAIIAAAAKGALEMRHLTITGDHWRLFLIGMVTSGVVGYIAVRFLLKFVTTHRLDVFAWYRVALAAGAAIWLATR